MLEVGHVAMRFVRQPRPPGVRMGDLVKGMTPYVSFDADAFEVEAAVDLRGSGAGARLGWTQLQTVDINRARYRGATAAAGRVEVFRDRSAKAMNRLCRDVMLASDVFTCPPGTRQGLGYTPTLPMNIDLARVRLPATVRVSHADKPGDAWFTEWDNDRTRQKNYLAWAAIEMQFCAVLILRHGDGRLEQLRHFYWGLNWEARFEPVRHGAKVAGVRPAGGDANNRVTFGAFVDGPVTDSHLAALIAAPGGQTCNERAYLRNNNPQVHHYASW